MFKDGKKLYSERLQFFSSLRVFDFSVKNVKIQNVDLNVNIAIKNWKLTLGQNKIYQAICRPIPIF
jgi:hypothetical protein